MSKTKCSNRDQGPQDNLRRPGKRKRERLYSVTRRGMWRDSAIGSVSDRALAQHYWLTTTQQLRRLPGVVVAGPAAIAEERRRRPAEIRAALEELVTAGLVQRDEPTHLNWVCAAIGDDPPDNPDVAVAWADDWLELPPSDVRTRLLEAIRALLVERQRPDQLAAFDTRVSHGVSHRGAHPIPIPIQNQSPSADRARGETMREGPSEAEVRDEWNRACEVAERCSREIGGESNLRMIKDVDPKAMKVISDHGLSIDDVREIFDRAARSHWYRERAEVARQLRLDWVLENREKILRGEFDRLFLQCAAGQLRAPSRSAARRSSSLERRLDRYQRAEARGQLALRLRVRRGLK
jgi:hypothetical protein